MAIIYFSFTVQGIGFINEKYPQATILVRGDRGFAMPELGLFYKIVGRIHQLSFG